MIICGDCLSAMRGMDAKSIDFVFADPPYGIGKAEWDERYPGGFEAEVVRIGKAGAITPGQENIAECINRLGSAYRGVLAARNKNGMTFNKVGFGNWIPVVLWGEIKRGQDFFEFSVCGTKPDHPSPKPIEFMLKLIERFTVAGDTILDPFLGSGTTGIACMKLGREFIGIELNPAYCEMARKQIYGELMEAIQ